MRFGLHCANNCSVTLVCNPHEEYNIQKNSNTRVRVYEGSNGLAVLFDETPKKHAQRGIIQSMLPLPCVLIIKYLQCLLFAQISIFSSCQVALLDVVESNW